MKREEEKELQQIIQAFVDGKTIQDYINDTCKDKKYTSFGELSKSPIKPEPKHRPFKSKEECWNEMLKHQPFGWVKSKDKDYFYLIGLVQFECEFEDVIITFATSENLARSSHYIYENYIFADGTPFGIKEE